MAVLLLGVLPLASASCAALYRSRPGEELKRSVRRFHEDLRWERYRSAARHLAPERRDEWVRAMREAGRSMRITEYRAQPVRVGDERAVVEVYLRYRDRDGVHVSRAMRRQVWRRRGGEWQLVEERTLDPGRRGGPGPERDRSDAAGSERAAVRPPASRPSEGPDG